MRRRRARRYGRSFGPQAITRPVGGDRYDVVLVDGHGNTIRTIGKRMPLHVARKLIARRHG